MQANAGTWTALNLANNDLGPEGALYLASALKVKWKPPSEFLCVVCRLMMPLPHRATGRWLISISRTITSKPKEPSTSPKYFRNGNARAWIFIRHCLIVFRVHLWHEQFSDIRDTRDIRDSGALFSLNLANNQLTGQFGGEMDGITALAEALPKW
jgi:hypothetical protein